MSHIFISYSRKDSVFADHLRNLLENEGFSIWMDQTRLAPGRDWESEIERAVQACGAFVVVMSRNSQDSVSIEREIRLAEKYNKRILPVLLDGVVWPRLAELQYDDMRAGVNARLSPRLAQALRLELEQPKKVHSGGSRRWMVWGAVLVLAAFAAILIALLSHGGDDEETSLPTDTIVNTPQATLDIADIVRTLDAQATVEQATLNVQTTAAARATEYAVGTKSAADQTATATLRTLTPTPNMTASIDAYRTRQAATNTQAWIDSWTDTPTPTPTPTSTPIPAGSAVEFGTRAEITLGGISFVYVPSGCFKMGSTDFENADPVHRVCLSSYWIGQTEVTNAQYKQCVDTGGCTPPGNTRYYYDVQYANHPVVYVDWPQASAYAAWLAESTGTNVRLPTEAQWEYAAAGPASNRFPWGDANATCILANFLNCVEGTSQVGSYPVGASWVGALDMSGNVWEWVVDRYNADYYGTLASGVWNPVRLFSGESALLVARGGSWLSHPTHALVTFRSNYGYYSTFDHLGFRVVSIP